MAEEIVRLQIRKQMKRQRRPEVLVVAMLWAGILIALVERAYRWPTRKLKRVWQSNTNPYRGWYKDHRPELADLLESAGLLVDFPGDEWRFVSIVSVLILPVRTSIMPANAVENIRERLLSHTKSLSFLKIASIESWLAIADIRNAVRSIVLNSAAGIPYAITHTYSRSRRSAA